MKIYDLYGFKSDDIEFLREMIEELLNIKMEARDNMSRGEYYKFENLDHEHYLLQINLDVTDEEFGEVWPQEDDFKDFKVILYVDSLKSVDRSEELKLLLLKIPGLEFLRHIERPNQ
jgi:hypothetical protein